MELVTYNVIVTNKGKVKSEIDRSKDGVWAIMEETLSDNSLVYSVVSTEELNETTIECINKGCAYTLVDCLERTAC